MTRNVGISD